MLTIRHRDVTFDTGMLWKSRILLVATEDIHSSPHTHSVAWQWTICYQRQRNRNLCCWFLYGKTLSSTNNGCTEVSLRHITRVNAMQDDAFQLDFRREGWGGTVTCGGALEGRRGAGSRLRRHAPASVPSWASALPASLFDSVIHPDTRPSDAENEITTYGKAIS